MAASHEQVGSDGRLPPLELNPVDEIAFVFRYQLFTDPQLTDGRIVSLLNNLEDAMREQLAQPDDKMETFYSTLLPFLDEARVVAHFRHVKLTEPFDKFSGMWNRLAGQQGPTEAAPLTEADVSQAKGS